MNVAVNNAGFCADPPREHNAAMYTIDQSVLMILSYILIFLRGYVTFHFFVSPSEELLR